MEELFRKIRKKYQREIGLIQDLVVENIYNFFPNAILHGGTLIWRCFGSNRFSEDLDFFLPKRNEKKIREFFENLRNLGFRIEKLRIKKRSVFSKLFWNKFSIRVEIVFKRVKAQLMDYECLDGRKIPILGVKVEDLINWKVDAFLKGRKIRDLYDIYFLLKFVKRSEKLKSRILKVLKKFEKPEDEADLKKIIIFGLAPSSEKIIDYLKRWVG